MMKQEQFIKIISGISIFLICATVAGILYALAILDPRAVPVVVVFAYFIRSFLLEITMWIINQFAFLCGLIFKNLIED